MAAVDTHEGTIKALQDRRARVSAELARLSAEVEALEKAIAILESIGAGTIHGGPSAPIPSPFNTSAEAGVFSQISIRWACLWILAQSPDVGLSSASVTDVLVRGGRTSKADRFASSVSAVLSNMRIKGEVAQIGNHWILTQSGQAALAAIQQRLDLFARQHLKYTKVEIDTMPLSKSKALLEADDNDYAAACNYYYGGANAASRPPF
jgi:hypothetical protein